MWGQARVNFTTCSSKKARGEEIMPMGTLITDGIGEGKLGMVTVFCHSDQVKVKPLVMLSTWAMSHGGVENLHQFSILPTGTLWPLFPQHSHPVRGCPSYPLSSLMTMPALAASVFLQPGHPAQGREGGKWAKDHPNHQGGTMGELHWGALSIIPGAVLAATLSPSHIPQHLQGQGFTDQQKTQLQHSSEAAASGHLGKVPTQAGATPWTAWAGCKGGWPDCHLQQGDWQDFEPRWRRR